MAILLLSMSDKDSIGNKLNIKGNICVLIQTHTVLCDTYYVPCKNEIFCMSLNICHSKNKRKKEKKGI